jgi:hypothetical protein
MIFYALSSAEIVQPCSDLPSFVVPETQALRSKGQGHFFVILASYLRCQFEGFLLGILFISQICPDLRFRPGIARLFLCHVCWRCPNLPVELL